MFQVIPAKVGLFMITESLVRLAILVVNLCWLVPVAVVAVCALFPECCLMCPAR
jgi:hypothetical protein